FGPRVEVREVEVFAAGGARASVLPWRRRLALEAGEAIDDVTEEARLALLAVGDHVDAGVGLVRRLVLREPNVAMDPAHRAVRMAEDLGRDRRELRVERLDEPAHRLPHLALVHVAIRLEPRLRVVALQVTQKLERRGAKSREAHRPLAGCQSQYEPPPKPFRR